MNETYNIRGLVDKQNFDEGPSVGMAVHEPFSRSICRGPDVKHADKGSSRAWETTELYASTRTVKYFITPTFFSTRTVTNYNRRRKNH